MGAPLHTCILHSNSRYFPSSAYPGLEDNDLNYLIVCAPVVTKLSTFRLFSDSVNVFQYTVLSVVWLYGDFIQIETFLLRGGKEDCET